MTEREDFARVAARFRCVLFDAYGVLKEQAGLLPGVPELLRDLDDQRCPWWVVSNDASRTPELLAAGYPDPVGPERFVSSGMVLRRHLAALDQTGLLAYLGPPACAGTFAGLRLTARPFQDLDDLSEVAVVALMDEAGFDWLRELTRLVNLMRERPAVPVLAPNPDRVYPARAGRVGLSTGSLVAVLEAATGRSIPHFGKPGLEIFQLALATAREAMPDLRPEEVLMVGDTLATDIAGAQAAGFRSVLVLSGNERPDTWEINAKRLGVFPDWVCPSVAG